MRKKYKIPLLGTVLSREPLTGDDADPIRGFPLAELPNLPTYLDEKTQKSEFEPFSYQYLKYNIDEEWAEIELDTNKPFHDWLAGILPRLNDIKKAKGWKLDKSKLQKK